MTHREGDSELSILVWLRQIHSRLHLELEEVDKLAVNALHLALRRNVASYFTSDELCLEANDSFTQVGLVKLELSVSVQSLSMLALYSKHQLLWAERNRLNEELQFIVLVLTDIGPFI